MQQHDLSPMWALSGNDPASHLSDDGRSVSISQPSVRLDVVVSVHGTDDSIETVECNKPGYLNTDLAVQKRPR